jgi:hypothetical protein
MPFKVQKALSKISGVGAGCGPCQEMEEKKIQWCYQRDLARGGPQKQAKTQIILDLIR